MRDVQDALPWRQSGSEEIREVSHRGGHQAPTRRPSSHETRPDADDFVVLVHGNPR
jgi:hypothetical protein